MPERNRIGTSYRKIRTTTSIVYRGIKASPFREVESSMAVEDADAENATLIQISPNHGRSLIDRWIGSGRVLWTDEYGNLYGARSSKGDILPEGVEVEEGVRFQHGIFTFPQGYRRWDPDGNHTYYNPDIRGLYDWFPERTIKASLFLRKNNVLTENITKADKVEKVSLNGTTMSINEYIMVRAEEQREKIVNGKLFSNRRFDGWLERIAENDYYIVERDSQVAERLRDLAIEDGWKCEQLEGSLRWLRLAIKYQPPAFYNPDLFREIDALHQEEKVERYFTEWLPGQIGYQLGLFHKYGIYHGSTGAGNITAIGTICDLDSCDGEPLGDYPNSHNHYVEESAGAMYGYIKWLFDKGYTNFEDPVVQGIVSEYIVGYVSSSGFSTPFDIEAAANTITALDNSDHKKEMVKQILRINISARVNEKLAPNKQFSF